jgi:hypothetical protein
VGTAAMDREGAQGRAAQLLQRHRNYCSDMARSCAHRLTKGALQQAAIGAEWAPAGRSEGAARG